MSIKTYLEHFILLLRMKEMHSEEKQNNLHRIVDLGEDCERNRCGAAENPQEYDQPGE